MHGQTHAKSMRGAMVEVTQCARATIGAAADE